MPPKAAYRTRALFAALVVASFVLAPASASPGKESPLRRGRGFSCGRTPLTLSAPAQGALVHGRQWISVRGCPAARETDLYIDQRRVSSDHKRPYGFGWDTGAWKNGRHELRARGSDKAGSTSWSAPVSVSVMNTSPTRVKKDRSAPSVTLTSPSPGTTLSGLAPVTATATDNVGVARVAFFIDGVLSTALTT